MCVGGSVCVLCYLLWGFMGCLCGFSKYEFEFKVVLCLCVDCSAPYQQCRQHTSCVCVCVCLCMCVSSVMPLHAVCASSLKTFMARRAERGQNGPERTTLAHTDPLCPTLCLPTSVPPTLSQIHTISMLLFLILFFTHTHAHTTWMVSDMDCEGNKQCIQL